jgi:FkbM family methyltransferase
MPDEVVSTPFGQFLIPKGDLIGETLRAGTLWDGPGFLQVIAREHGALGEPGATILDVGANLGAFPVWLARQGAWRVIAVEPVPETMRYLKANLDLNKAWCAGTVIPLEVAAYSHEAWLCWPPLDRGNLGGTALSHSGDEVCRVSAEPLDKYQWLFGSRVSLIVVDAQGCDGAAILGLAATITRDHPAIAYEWEADLAPRHGHTLEAIQRQLLLWGYRTREWPSHLHNFVAVWKGER